MPVSVNSPSTLHSEVLTRSPSYTLNRISVWLSSHVVNSDDFLVGIWLLRPITTDMRAPLTSMPSDSGVTSSSSSDLVASLPWPVRMAACTAAPYATASSGLMDLLSALPLKNAVSSACTLGMRVEPPTSTTSCTAFLAILLSFSTCSTGFIVDANRSAHSSSNLARVMVALKSLPSTKPSISTVACVAVDSVRLARSHAVRKRRTARTFYSARQPLHRVRNTTPTPPWRRPRRSWI